MDRLNFESKLNSFDYISKLNLRNKNDIPVLEKAVVSVKLKVISEYDIRIPHALTFMDWFTGQRGFIKSFKFIYRYNKPIIQVLLSCTLRRSNLNNLFDYLLICFFEILKHRLNTTRVVLLPSSFSFFIKDVNFFYNVPHFLYNFTDLISVQFYLKNAITKESLKLFLSSYTSIFKYLNRNK